VATGRDRADRLLGSRSRSGTDVRWRRAGPGRHRVRSGVLALTGTPTSAFSMAEQPLADGAAAQGEVGSADRRSTEAPWTPTDDGTRHRPHHRLDQAVNSLRGAGPRAKLEKLVRDRRGGSSGRSGPALSQFNDPTAETVASSPKQT
jgi:hypothetical protein